MKKFRLFFVAVLILVLLAGCSVDVRGYEEPQVRSQCETILGALLTGNYEAAYEPFRNSCAESDFTPAYDQLRQYLAGTEDYELTLLSARISTKKAGGETIKVSSAVYEMDHAGKKTVLNISLQENVGVVTFMLTPYEDTDYSSTGTLGRMKGASLVQWLFLLLNVVSLAVAAYAIVDCVRRKVEKKVLWILVLLFGFFTVGVTISDSMFRMNFNLSWITAYSALIRYGSGTMVARLMLPVGAIAYFLSNRTKPGETPSREVEEPAETEQTDNAE